MNTIKKIMKTIFSNPPTVENRENLPSIYDIQIKGLNNKPINLAAFKGKNILFVNVASKCGFTNQYTELQELSDRYKDSIVVIGVPCNQFGKQEPGDANAIQNFCEINYGVTFLITEKIEVKGKNAHPLYQWLTQEQKNGVLNTSVKWNFQKYLVNAKGELVDYYFSSTKPLSKKITKHL